MRCDPEFAARTAMTRNDPPADRMNLATHRGTTSVWNRRGWNGTADRLAVTRWLAGIGGAALVIQGVRQQTRTGGLLAGIGGGLAWWALRGPGDLSKARPLVQACRRTVVPTRGSRPAGEHRIVSGKRRPLVDTNRGHRRATRRLGETEWNAKAAKAAEKYRHSFAAFSGLCVPIVTGSDLMLQSLRVPPS